MAGKTEKTRRAPAGPIGAIGTGVGLHPTQEDQKVDLAELIRAVVEEVLGGYASSSMTRGGDDETNAYNSYSSTAGGTTGAGGITPEMYGIIMNLAINALQGLFTSALSNILAYFQQTINNLQTQIDYLTRQINNISGGGIGGGAIYKRITDHASSGTYNCRKQDWLNGAWSDANAETQIIENVEESATGHGFFGDSYFAALDGADTGGVMPGLPLQGMEVYKSVSWVTGGGNDGKYNCILQTHADGVFTNDGTTEVVCQNVLESDGHEYNTLDQQLFVRLAGVPATNNAIPVIPLSRLTKERVFRMVSPHLMITAPWGYRGGYYDGRLSYWDTGTKSWQSVTLTNTLLFNIVESGWSNAHMFQVGDTVYFRQIGETLTGDQANNAVPVVPLNWEIRKAFAKYNASTGTTMDCFLDSDESAYVVTVSATVPAGSDLQDCIPQLKDGDMIYAYNDGGTWRSLTTFQNVPALTGNLAGMSRPIRLAYVKTVPSSGSNVNVYLDTYGSGTEVSVSCVIYNADGAGGSFSVPTMPSLEVGMPFWVCRTVENVWVNVTPIFNVGVCP